MWILTLESQLGINSKEYYAKTMMVCCNNNRK